MANFQSSVSDILTMFDDDTSTSDSITTADLQKPILVGYAFGPKKMSTMATVMAEASRAHVVGVVYEDETELPLQETSSLTTEALSLHQEAMDKFVLSSTPHALANVHAHGTNTCNHTGSGLNHIVRYFRSSCSSVGSDDMCGSITSTSGSLMTRRSGSGAYPVRVSFVPVDLNEPLEEQHGGNFDIILHKMTEDILCLSTADPTWKAQWPKPDVTEDETLLQAMERIHRLKDYQQTHPHCSLTDDPTNVEVVMSRSAISVKLQQALVGVTSASGLCVETPTFMNYRQPEEDHTLRYPLIAKPLPAAGTKKSHCMGVVLNPSGLSKVQSPCLLQEYANHDAVLYKVYVLGDLIHVFRRPSLPNLPTEAKELAPLNPYVEFDSQRPYPNLQDFGIDSPTVTDASMSISLSAVEVTPIVQALKRAFGLELFGFDILISNETLMVVDVNYFPSFKEVANFPSLLAKFLVQRAVHKRKSTA